MLVDYLVEDYLPAVHGGVGGVEDGHLPPVPLDPAQGVVQGGLNMQEIFIKNVRKIK